MDKSDGLIKMEDQSTYEKPEEVQPRNSPEGKVTENKDELICEANDTNCTSSMEPVGKGETIEAEIGMSESQVGNQPAEITQPDNNGTEKGEKFSPEMKEPKDNTQNSVDENQTRKNSENEDASNVDTTTMELGSVEAAEQSGLGNSHPDGGLSSSVEPGQSIEQSEPEVERLKEKREDLFQSLFESAQNLCDKLGDGKDNDDDNCEEDEDAKMAFLGVVEGVLSFGLKSKLCQSVMDIAAQRHQQSTPIAVLTVKEFSPVLWDYLKETIDADVVQTFSSLANVETDFGRGKAWVANVLNNKMLQRCFESAFQTKTLLERYYDEFSCVRSNKSALIMSQISDKVSHVDFRFPTDARIYDKPKEQRTKTQEKVWHYEIHAPWPNDQMSQHPAQFLETPYSSEVHSVSNPNDPQMGQIQMQDQEFMQPESNFAHSSQVNGNQTFTELSNFDPSQLPATSHVNEAYEYQDASRSESVTRAGHDSSSSSGGHEYQAAASSQTALQSENATYFANQNAHFIPQYHSMQMQHPHLVYNDNVVFQHQRSQQMLPKIEELMAPPTGRPHPQEYQGGAQMMYGNEYFLAPTSSQHTGMPPPSQYEPISPAMGDMPMYPSQPSSATGMIPSNLSSDHLDLDSMPEMSSLSKKFCQPHNPETMQLKIMPNNRAEIGRAMRGRRNPTGRGRGRPRQRPKIQGLPPPQCKEEAREQTATFHRVYERVRRTEIKKGYDILENLIPFHLRSDILGKKKHFSTTDVLNCARDYIEELKSDEIQHQIIINQMETERNMWKNRLRKLTLEAIKRNKVLLSNESLAEFETMEYKTSLSRFIPHVCLPNIGIQTGVFQEIPANSPESDYNAAADSPLPINSQDPETFQDHSQMSYKSQDQTDHVVLSNGEKIYSTTELIEFGDASTAYETNDQSEEQTQSPHVAPDIQINETTVT